MNIPHKFWSLLNAFIGVLIALAAIFCIKGLKSIAYVGAGIQPTDTINVDGSGDAYAVPDVATFSFTVSDTEKDVASAQAKVTSEEAGALSAVRAAGVAGKDIQTESYSITPQYEYQNAVCPQTAVSSSVSSAMAPNIAYCPPGKQTLTGYQVSEDISVKLRDLTKAGSLLASLGSAGVSDLSGPSFAVDDPDAVQADARAKAIADAQTKAKALAKELGVSLAGVVSFTEDTGGTIRPVMYAMDASAAAPAAAPQVPAGQQKVTDTVTITYEIR